MPIKADDSSLKKKRRGPPPAVSDEDIVAVLKDLDVFDQDGKLKKELDPVWSAACNILKSLHHNIHRHNLYSKVQTKNSKIRRDLLRKDGEISNAEEKIPIEKVAKSEVKVSVNTSDALAVFLKDKYLKPMIKELCDDPLHLLYWWPEQIGLYKDFTKINDCNTPVIINIFKNIKKEIVLNQEAKNINVCVVFSQIDDVLVSFCQALMVRTDKDIFEYFFSEWLRQKIPVPSDIICPISIMEAVSLSFNLLTIEMYVLQCFKHLRDPNIKLPPSRLKIEMLPFIKNVQKLIHDCFDKDFKFVHEFYLRSIIVISLTKDFYIFEMLIKRVFILLKSTHLDHKVNSLREDLLREMLDDSVNQCFEKFNQFCEMPDAKTTSDDEITRLFECNNSLTDVSKYLKSRYLEIETMCLEQTANLNPYKNEKFLRVFLKLLNYFPIWTNLVMRSDDKFFFKTSEMASKYFCSLSSHSSNTENNMFLAEEFVPSHADFLKTCIQKGQLAIADVSKVKLPESIEQNSTIEYSFLDFKEDWMGRGDVNVTNNNFFVDTTLAIIDNEDLKGVKSTNIVHQFVDDSLPFTDNFSTNNDKNIIDENTFCESGIDVPKKFIDSFHYLNDSERISHEHSYYKTVDAADIELLPHPVHAAHSTPKNSNAKYLNPFPGIKILHNKPKIQNLVKRLIKNKQPRTIKKIQYHFENPSSFDSIAEILSQALTNYNNFDEYCVKAVEHDVCNTSFLKAIVDYAHSANIAGLYKAKLMLLLTVGELNGTYIHCRKKLNIYFSKYMERHASITKQIFCGSCNGGAPYYITTSLLQISGKSMKQIDSFLRSMLLKNSSQQLCTQCGVPAIEVRYEFGNYIALDIEHENVVFDIHNLVYHFNLNNKEYFLAGVISYEPSVLKPNEIFYTAYCRSLNGTWQKRENTAQKVEFLNKRSVSAVKIAMVFYVENPN